jgi:LemA protein
LDLIPNLVNTVKGYASHERETLEGVINARANATKTTIDPSNLNEETMKQFQAAQGELSNALSRLMVVVERYPDLKANQNFLELQAQLEGTENRISVERKRFNETAQSYNTNIRSFPTNILAGMFGFQPKAYFAAESGAEKAPTVEF